MAQPAIRAEMSSPPAELTIVQKLDGLGRDWTVLRDCRLRPSDRGSAPTVLIHPGQGIAVLDVAPSATPDAVDAVRAKLDASRFESIFAGHLPVVHLTVTPRQMASLQMLLDDAFAALPPLELPGGDAWAGVAARALRVEHHAVRRIDPSQPRPEPVENARHPLLRRRARRRRGSFLRKTAIVLLSLAALGGLAAVALKEMPSLDPRTPTAAPSVTAVVPPVPSSPRPDVPMERGTTALPMPPPPAEAAPPALAPRAPNGARTAAPASDALSPAPPPIGEATPPRAVPAPSPQPAETPQQQQTRRPAERIVAPQPQPQARRQESGTNPAPTGGAPSLDGGPQRCSRIAARVGSGAAVSEADMRFFNEACIRW